MNTPHKGNTMTASNQKIWSSLPVLFALTMAVSNGVLAILTNQLQHHVALVAFLCAAVIAASIERSKSPDVTINYHPTNQRQTAEYRDLLQRAHQCVINDEGPSELAAEIHRALYVKQNKETP